MRWHCARDVVDVVTKAQHASTGDLEIGRLLLDVNQRASAHGLRGAFRP
jgi:hypothetical protein